MDTQNNYYQPPRNNGGKNTGLIVAVAVLSAVLVIGIVFAILVAADVISFGGKEQTPIQQTQVTDAIGTEEQAHKDETPAQTTPAAPQPIPVGATMYVGNCNVSVTLRSAPSTSSSELCQIPLAEEIYVVEYTNDEFARVRYNGTEGYVKRAYIVSVRPQVYSYDSQEAAQLVHNAVVAFVDGVNSNSDAYVSAYYSGSAADEERKSVKSIVEKVISEEIISLNCHSVTRVSATQVSVIRDSVIRVLYNDNTVKDITERYKYTVDISGTSYKIVGLSKA
ncbi:MAG: SH3 domain-containing protein [Clostridiales bacterium]|nr:SH3 domain-containing protein [Clostridiales bacterium]